MCQNLPLVPFSSNWPKDHTGMETDMQSSVKDVKQLEVMMEASRNPDRQKSLLHLETPDWIRALSKLSNFHNVWLEIIRIDLLFLLQHTLPFPLIIDGHDIKFFQMGKIAYRIFQTIRPYPPPHLGRKWERVL